MKAFSLPEDTSLIKEGAYLDSIKLAVHQVLLGSVFVSDAALDKRSFFYPVSPKPSLKLTFTKAGRPRQN